MFFLRQRRCIECSNQAAMSSQRFPIMPVLSIEALFIGETASYKFSI